MATAIKIENISKQYRLGEVGTGTLSHDLHRAWAKLRGKPDPFAKVGEVNNREEIGGEYAWALKDVSFEVEQGEILGIIGRNGAGKSTLLKLLSRVTAPTTGTIKTRGRIASLLEVGTGFHPELTGRENVYLNGAIMGMTRPEISRRLEEIIEFSGCAKYIDTPVKRYSSGMMVRLGFSVASHLECEIMIVDEVLAVGDSEFQKSCIAKMQDVSTSTGRTILFVSHNLGAVANLCSNAILLDNGSIRERGDVDSILSLYQQVSASSQDRTIEACRRKVHYTGKAEFTDIRLVNNKNSLRFGEALEAQLTFTAHDHFENLSFGGSIFEASGECVATFFTPETIKANPGETYSYRVCINDLAIVPGNYHLAFSVGNGSEKSGRSDHDVVVGMPAFCVEEVDCNGHGIAHWYRGWGALNWSSKVQVTGLSMEMN